MARPKKDGLDYFPFDVDFFNDEKIMAISGEFGIKGEITAIKLLCAIYRNGYFILWNDLLKYKLLKTLPGISPELLESIVNRLVLWGFFDKALFDSTHILTSKGIQNRYFEAVKRRIKKDDDLPYLLVSVDRNGVSAYINPPQKELMSTETPQSKENKIKENSNTPNVVLEKKKAASAATLSRKENFGRSLIPYVDKYGKEMIREFFDYWSEMNKSKSKMRFEQQPTWETSKRLATWAKRERNYAKDTGGHEDKRRGYAVTPDVEKDYNSTF